MQAQQYTEEQLQDTDVAKGFKAFTYISDLMRRYPFDLRVTRGGRIFGDDTTDMKLRRKFDKADKDQNSVFEAYKTQDGNNVTKSTVTISKDAFSPSMLLAAVASQLANDGDNITNRIAIMMIQGASALLQERDKELNVLANVIKPKDGEVDTRFYEAVQDVQTRAYATTILADLAQYTIGDNDKIYSLSDSMQTLSQVDDAEYGDGAKMEASNTLNLMYAAVSNMAFSNVFTDIQVMADEIKNTIGEAALVELSDKEIK